MTAFARRIGTAGLAGLLVAFSEAAAHAQQARARYPLDTLSPKSDITRWFVSIFWNVTIWDSIILLVVVVALFLAIFVFSSRTGEPGVSSTKESDMYLELAWTVIPSLILVAITVPTVKAIIATQPDRWPAETLPIRVIAHQWWWEFNYPTLGVETGDEFHIPIRSPDPPRDGQQRRDPQLLHAGNWRQTRRRSGPDQPDNLQGGRSGRILGTVHRVLRRLARQHALSRLRGHAREFR